MKDLQDIINERARARAEKEVKEFIDNLKKNNTVWKIVGKTRVFEKEPLEDDKGTTASLREAFWWTDRTLVRKWIEELTAIYVPIETKKFVDDVENLKQTTDELFGQVEDLEHKQRN